MTSQGTYRQPLAYASRQPLAYASTSDWTPVPDGVAVTVAGLDGTVIATISRRFEPTGGEPAAAGASMSVVAVDGDVDLDTAVFLEHALISAINDRPRTCLDLRHVDFFSAAGVHVLIAAHRHATRLGRSLVLHGVHGIAERILIIVGLDRLIPHETDMTLTDVATRLPAEHRR